MKVQSKIFSMSSALIVAIVASSSGFSPNADAGLFDGGKSKLQRKIEKLERKEEKREDLEDEGRGDSWRHSKMVGDAAKTRDQIRALREKQEAELRAAERVSARYDRDQENQNREEELERIRRRDRERYEENRYERDVHSSTSSRTTDDYSGMSEEVYTRGGCPQGYLEDETEIGHCVRFDLWTPGKCDNVGKGNRGQQGNSGKQGTDPVTPPSPTPSPVPSPVPSPEPSPEPEYCDLDKKEIDENGNCVDKKKKHDPVKPPKPGKDKNPSKPSTKKPAEKQKHDPVKKTAKGKGGKGKGTKKPPVTVPECQDELDKAKAELAKVKADKDASDAEKAAALEAKKKAEADLAAAQKKAAEERAADAERIAKLEKANATVGTINLHVKKKDKVTDGKLFGNKSKTNIEGDVSLTGTAEGLTDAVNDLGGASLTTTNTTTSMNVVKTLTDAPGGATAARAQRLQTIMKTSAGN